MSKRYTRQENILERLEKENRELKAINRSLMKRLRTVSKGYYKFLNEESEEKKEAALEKVFKEVEKICWTCRIGKLQKIDLVSRYYRACDNCTYRTKSKPTAKKVK